MYIWSASPVSEFSPKFITFQVRVPVLSSGLECELLEDWRHGNRQTEHTVCRVCLIQWCKHLASYPVLYHIFQLRPPQVSTYFPCSISHLLFSLSLLLEVPDIFLHCEALTPYNLERGSNLLCYQFLKEFYFPEWTYYGCTLLQDIYRMLA